MLNMTRPYARVDQRRRAAVADPVFGVLTLEALIFRATELDFRV